MVTHASPLTTAQGLWYGLLGLPLAFVALPLYVVLPNHYARTFGMPLATIGTVLLVARLFDAFIDPLIGRWSDHLYGRSVGRVLAMGAGAACVLALGFLMLFFPLPRAPAALVAWLFGFLSITYLAYSALTVAHQSWGAKLGGGAAQRSRIVAWREGLGLAGVVLASVLPLVIGLAGTSAVFCVLLALGWLAWCQAPRPRAARSASRLGNSWLPFAQPDFRRLLAVFVLNGIASAIPATLVLFFIQDRLQSAPAMEPLFLGTYFVCAALSLPLWLRLVARRGLAGSWLWGIVLAVAAFSWAFVLGPGDDMAFVAVCALSGAALGTDLALPGALLAGVIQRAGDTGRAEGIYFGWWNFATKLNLALAAGLSLPLLGLFGYAPGTRDAQALFTLATAYCVLPCALKLLAGAALYRFIVLPEKMRAAA